MYASEADDTDYQERTEGDAEKSGYSQPVRRDSSDNHKKIDDPIFPPTPPPSPPRSPESKNSKRVKRVPCTDMFESISTPKPVSTTGVFSVKFKDEDEPIDAFTTVKREAEYEPDMRNEEAFLQNIKDQESKDITILMDSWNAIKARHGSDNKLPTANEFTREVVSRGMPLNKALEKWWTLSQLNEMWESNTKTPKKINIDYKETVQRIENYIRQRQEINALNIIANPQLIDNDEFPHSLALNTVQRAKRSSNPVLQSSKTVWRNVMPVHFDDHPGQPTETFRVLIMGGNHVGDERYPTVDASS